MVIQGGLDYQNLPLNDMWLLDMIKIEWFEMKIKIPLYKHTLTPVFDNERKIENLLQDFKFKEEADFKTLI